MSNNNINYYFQHKETKVNVTPKDWTHFFELQRNKEYTQISMYQLEDNSKGVIPYKYWQSRNRFWQGAEGFEKNGKLICSGIPCSSYLDTIRLFLRELHNHACMQGDKKTAVKAKREDRFFYSPSVNYNGIHTKLLTA